MQKLETTLTPDYVSLYLVLRLIGDVRTSLHKVKLMVKFCCARSLPEIIIIVYLQKNYPLISSLCPYLHTVHIDT